ncbi:hypothetical protein [Granulicella arctica]|uniref:Alpha-L-rhamnosidase six-hairpin glycosidase domain-containing protein n=1 Tax=Granulicella arctica TaxID=940613 RepID=A0A7Y9PFB6_9BACT|nr:hypothetical protein [Granulicella arctica]NYF78877.1 hypothetical protein [Granulicella arctica]
MTASAVSQMVSPEIDRPSEPFSYFSKPADEIGVVDARTATEVTPEGYLYTGYGEVLFFTGGMDKPFSQRVKTLEDGDTPILHYGNTEDGIQYDFTVFEASLSGKPDGPLVNFIRVVVRNTSSAQRAAYFSIGQRYINAVNTPNSGGDNRYIRPRPWGVQNVYQEGEVYSPDWVYGFHDNAFLRDGKAVYLFPASSAPRLRLTLKEGYNREPDLMPRKLDILPDTPVGIAQFQMKLAPGDEKTLVFKQPVVPVSPSSPVYQQLEAAQFDDYLQQTKLYWRSIFGLGMQLHVPEPKVEETYRASLAYNLLALDKIGDYHVQTVNKFQYHRFYLRDSADIAHMYDVTGYPDIARDILEYIPTTQQPDGNFVSQPGQLDGWGEALYAFGAHYRMTHDMAFATQMYPYVQKAIPWLQHQREQDPLHLISATNVLDNEYVPGHLTGNNFLALDGLKNAMLLAKALGQRKDLAADTALYNDYHRTLLSILEPITAKTGGYIPPTLDGTTAGEDWGNMLSVTPEPLLDPFDPRVTATLHATQAKYEEGIMSYGKGRYLHHYLTIKNTLTEVIRDDEADQMQAVKELYGVLLHTSSTHTGFEYAIHPWGDRNFGINLSPHGWFAADYRTLLRDMLVREDEKDLHLLSVVSPEWIQPGQSISVSHAPTAFGTIDFSLLANTQTDATLTFHADIRYGSPRIFLHLPWFMEVSSVVADGKPLPVVKGTVTLAPTIHTVQIHWSKRSDTPTFSYKQAVEDYKQEYARRYQQYLQDGFQP